MSLIPETSNFSAKSWVGDVNVAGGQLGLCPITTQTVNLDQLNDFEDIYARYLLEPTVAGLNFTFHKIGPNLGQIAPGYSVLVVNEGTEPLDILEDSGSLLTNLPSQSLAWFVAEAAGSPDLWFLLYKTLIIKGTDNLESNYNNTLFIDSKYGDDNTGQRENPNYPFLTALAAYNAAQARDQIIVFSIEDKLSSEIVPTDKWVYWYNYSRANRGNDFLDFRLDLDIDPTLDNYFYSYGMDVSNELSTISQADINLLYRFFITNSDDNVDLSIKDINYSGLANHDNWTFVLYNNDNISVITNGGYGIFIAEDFQSDDPIGCPATNPNFNYFENLNEISIDLIENTEVHFYNVNLETSFSAYVINMFDSTNLTAYKSHFDSVVFNLNSDNVIILNKITGGKGRDAFEDSSIQINGVAGQNAHSSIRAAEAHFSSLIEGSSTARISRNYRYYFLVQNQDYFVEGDSPEFESAINPILREAYHYIVTSPNTLGFDLSIASSNSMVLYTREITHLITLNTIKCSGNLFLKGILPGSSRAKIENISETAVDSVFCALDNRIDANNEFTSDGINGLFKFTGQVEFIFEAPALRDIDSIVSVFAYNCDYSDIVSSGFEGFTQLYSFYLKANEGSVDFPGVVISSDPAVPQFLGHYEITNSSISLGSNIPSNSLVTVNSIRINNLDIGWAPDTFDVYRGVCSVKSSRINELIIGKISGSDLNVPLNIQVFIRTDLILVAGAIQTAVFGGDEGIADLFIESTSGIDTYDLTSSVPHYIYVHRLYLNLGLQSGSTVQSDLLDFYRGQVYKNAIQTPPIRLINHPDDTGAINRKLVASGRFVNGDRGILVEDDPTQTQIITRNLGIVANIEAIANTSGINVDIQEEAALTSNVNLNPTDLTELINTIGVNAGLPLYG